MSTKYGKLCKTYNIPLNSNDSDIFSISCGHLYNFLQLKSNHRESTECKSMMLKMHLEFYESAFEAEAEEEKEMESNDLHKAARQTVQQLEIQIKALQDAMDRLQKNIVNKPPDVDNNTNQDSNSSQQTCVENKLSDEHSDTENVARTELLDLRANCVYIQSFKCSDSSLEKAFANVRKLANEMKAQIPDNSIAHIEVTEDSSYYLDYYVYFRNADIKNEFLKNRLHYKCNLYGRSILRILDYSNWGIVDLKLMHTSITNLEAAFKIVIKLAQKMGMKNIRKYIDHIDVSSAYGNTILSVRFNNERVKDKFRFNLNHYSETKYLQVTDRGGHSLDCDNLNNISMTTFGDNIIGVAALMGLSLTINNFKRICILNPKAVGTFSNEFYISLMVEFTSKHMKNEFLQKKLNLDQIQNKSSYSFEDTRPSPIEIWDIEADDNVVFIKYNKSWPNFSTAVSFIGMAKRVGLSLTRYQINRFIAFSKFI